MKKNGQDIKTLYLNNLNSNEVIDLNKETLDFSIFDKNEFYTTTHNKLNNLLAI